MHSETTDLPSRPNAVACLRRSRTCLRTALHGQSQRRRANQPCGTGRCPPEQASCCRRGAVCPVLDQCNLAGLSDVTKGYRIRVKYWCGAALLESLVAGSALAGCTSHHQWRHLRSGGVRVPFWLGVGLGVAVLGVECEYSYAHP